MTPRRLIISCLVIIGSMDAPDTDAENGWVRTTLRIKDLGRSGVAKTKKKLRVIVFMIFTKYFLENQKNHCPTDQISLQLLIRLLRTAIQVFLPHLVRLHIHKAEAVRKRLICTKEKSLVR